MFPELLRKQMLNNQYLLFDNQVKLVTKEKTMQLVNGTPSDSVVEAEHWVGAGSIQYVRPRIQKSIADENAGTMEDSVAVVCYVPFEAMPDESMSVVDVDGVLGTPGAYLVQSRVPANVGGLGVYWELYIGEAVNA